MVVTMELGISAVSSHTAVGELVVNLVLGGANVPQKVGTVVHQFL